MNTNGCWQAEGYLEESTENISKQISKLSKNE